MVSPWYKKRPYVHFDLPLNEKDATDYVSDPKSVAQHAFYPFLTYTLLTPRIRKPPPRSPKSFVKYSKIREISYPSHKDGYIFSYYKSKLEPIYEEWLRKHGLQHAVTAFRSTGKNNVTLAKEAFDFIKANPGCRIVATDIESFFPNINHDTLKQTWARFLDKQQLPDDHYAVYRAITRYSVVERYKVYNLFGIRLSDRLGKVGDPERLCTPKEFRKRVVPRGLVKPNPGLPKRIGIPKALH